VVSARRVDRVGLPARPVTAVDEVLQRGRLDAPVQLDGEEEPSRAERRRDPIDDLCHRRRRAPQVEPVRHGSVGTTIGQVEGRDVPLRQRGNRLVDLESDADPGVETAREPEERVPEPANGSTITAPRAAASLATAATSRLTRAGEPIARALDDRPAKQPDTARWRSFLWR
jgi:hypothetical protein